MPDIKVIYDRGGVFLPQLNLWLDAHHRQMGNERVFVSHAHADHLKNHREVIVSEPTSFFMHYRLKGKRHEHVMAYGETVSFKDAPQPYQITLLPAGHILGSAMALIETGNTRLLYTGDFKLKPSLTAEVCQTCQADILIMETTFGRPHYCFPEREQLRQQAEAFCRETLAAGCVPFLIAYSLGKSQETLKLLEGMNSPFVLHEQAFELTKIYHRFNQSFPVYHKWGKVDIKDHIAICPPIGQRARVGKTTVPVRTAIFSGWAMDDNCRFRAGTDAAFPLSDHADYQELIELTRLVSPKIVYTLHGFAADFADTLRKKGLDARALSEQDQLSLPLE